MTSRVILISLITLAHTACQNSNRKEETETTMIESTPTANPYYSRTDTTKLSVPDSEWQKVLPDSVFQIARNKGTEYAFSGKYWKSTEIGTYYCAACGNKLFRSDNWFSSSCGWPSFFETDRENAVRYEEDNSHGMRRIEVLCGRCDGHLGHLFDDGPAPTHKRYCMNSLVLDFEPDSQQAH
jgi:peptide-methionine (R)-S-oxide reductase